MSLMLKCLPYVALYYGILGLSVLVAKYIVYIDLLVVIGIVAAPALAAYSYLKKYLVMPSKNEAAFLTVVCGSLVFYMFASVDIEQMHEPIVGVLFRLIFLLFGVLFGYGICALYFFNGRMWSAQIAKLNQSKQSRTG